MQLYLHFLCKKSHLSCTRRSQIQVSVSLISSLETKPGKNRLFFLNKAAVQNYVPYLLQLTLTVDTVSPVIHNSKYRHGAWVWQWVLTMQTDFSQTLTLNNLTANVTL